MGSDIDLMSIFGLIDQIRNTTILEAISAYAITCAQNIALADENEWLTERLAEEDARLAHA